jgi:hypothetical protein
MERAYRIRLISERNGGALRQVHDITLVVSDEGIRVVSPSQDPLFFGCGKHFSEIRLENNEVLVVRFSCRVKSFFWFVSQAFLARH